MCVTGGLSKRAFPGLLRILAEFGVPASFFVAFGPDNSGKAVRRIFRRGFLRKMIRTRAPSTYGLKTLLYGTLLPAPLIGEALPQLLNQIKQARHEVGLHGWDHVGWHDGLARMSHDDVRGSLRRACRALRAKPGSSTLFLRCPGLAGNAGKSPNSGRERVRLRKRLPWTETILSACCRHGAENPADPDDTPYVGRDPRGRRNESTSAGRLLSSQPSRGSRQPIGAPCRNRRASLRGLVAHLPGSFTPAWSAILAPLHDRQTRKLLQQRPTRC